MSKLIAKISYERLERFLWLDDFDGFIVSGHRMFKSTLSKATMLPGELVEEFKSYSGNLGYVYLFHGDEYPDEAVAKDWPHNVLTIEDEHFDDGTLDGFAGSREPGGWYARISPTDEDVTRAVYLSVTPCDGQEDSGLTGISIENFKGVGERIELDIRPLTLIFGPNSAGKSTIFHAFQYAAEVLDRMNPDADQTVRGGEFVNLGGFASLVHRHDLNRTVRIRLKLSHDDKLWNALEEASSMHFVNQFFDIPSVIESYASDFGNTGDAEVEVGVTWSAASEQPFVSSYRLSLAGEPFSEVTVDSEGREAVIAYLNLQNKALTTFSQWIVHDTVELRDALSDRYEDPDESLLSACLRESAPLLFRITTEGHDNDAPILLESLPSAIPAPGKQIEVALKTRNEAFGDKSEDDDNKQLHHLAIETAQGLSKLLSVPLELVRGYLQDFRYLGPIRILPPRNFHPRKSRDTTTTYDSERWPSGIGAWEELFRRADQLIPKLNEWLADESSFNAGYELALKRYKELDLADPMIAKLVTGRAFDDVEDAQYDLDRLATSARLVILPDVSEIELQPCDVGIGISQVIPVLVTALDASTALSAIEQPELHLHPRMQAELGDVLIRGSRTKNLLIETHSEHLILRLQRRIRESAKTGNGLHSRDVAIYYASQEAGATNLRRIDLDENGEFIQPWPDDFFEIDFYERFSE